MKKITLTLLLLLTTTIFIKAQDTCQTAILVTVGTYNVGFINGDAAPINCINHSNGPNGEWYKYTAIENVEVTITTSLPTNNGLDTRFHVYSGSCNNLVCVGGDDDSGTGETSISSFNAQSGTDYYIVFDNNWSSNSLDFEITEQEIVEVPGDVTFSPQSISNLGSPYMVVDMNGDLLDDLVSVSSNTVRINYQKDDQTFDTVNVSTPNANNNPGWSIAAGDLDGNGYMDLLYGGSEGATFMLANTAENSNDSNSYATNYSEISPEIYIFSQRTNFVDINNDGDLDAFVCHDVDSNVYFINDGDGGLITHQVGDGSSVNLGILGRNYATIWIDYDNDHDLDMFISKCGGSPEATENRLYQNNGNGTYTDVSVVSGLNSAIQTWSSAWGDFDNDGFMDVMVGASIGSNEFMRNNGDGTFTDVTAGSGFDTFNIVSHEYIAKDFNNDGFIDILASGHVMINNGNMTFTDASSSVGQGAIGDANDDGFLDVFTNGTIKINNNTEGNWLNVHTTGVESNLDGIGARVEITSTLGTQIRDIRSGVGFKYMSSMTAHFGIGEDTAIESVTVYWPSGNIDTINNPTINSTLNIIEGSAPLTIDENLLSNVSIYPNPVENELTINSNLDLEDSIITIFNIQGKKVINSHFNSNKINIANLESGIYFLRIVQNNKEINLKFIKK